MSIEDALSKASARPAGKRPYFFTPEVERVLSITLAVSQELAVTRQRLDTVERLLAEKGIIEKADIDDFVPSEEQHAERGLWNQEYVVRIFRLFQQEAEAVEAAKKGEPTSEEFHHELFAERE